MNFKFVPAPISGSDFATARQRVASRWKTADLMTRVDLLQSKLQEALAQGRLKLNRTPPATTHNGKIGDSPDAGVWSWLFTKNRTCPSCRSTQIHRSHRRGNLEYDLSIVAMPFRCEMCRTRFFVC